MTSSHFSLVCLLVAGTSTRAVAQVSMAQLTRLKTHIRQDIIRTLQRGERQQVATKFQVNDFRTLTYPTYYYNEPADSASKHFGNLAKYFRLDTTRSQAAFFIKDKLVLIASGSGSGSGIDKHYSFYPVDPPLAEKRIGLGLGSSDSTRYDVKLVKATLPYQASAFILMPAPIFSPTIMGFYKNGKLHFVYTDDGGKANIVCDSLESLIISLFGSKQQYIERLAQQQLSAKEHREWAKKHPLKYHLVK